MTAATSTQARTLSAWNRPPRKHPVFPDDLRETALLRLAAQEDMIDHLLGCFADTESQHIGQIQQAQGVIQSAEQFARDYISQLTGQAPVDDEANNLLLRTAAQEDMLDYLTDCLAESEEEHSELFNRANKSILTSMRKTYRYIKQLQEKNNEQK